MKELVHCFYSNFIVCFVIFWVVLFGQSLQFPQGLQEKRFNIEAVPSRNGKIMLHLKGRYGSVGADGEMGDRGPAGIPGIPGLMGERGNPGFCSAQLCDAMEQARSLLSRVEALEKLVKSRNLLDQREHEPADRPVMALHITSDILLTRGNVSNGKNGASGLPRNINLNIALKNDMKQSSRPVSTTEHNGKFLINSTIFLDRKEQKSGIAKAPMQDQDSDMANKQFQNLQSGSQQEEVPSIKRDKISHRLKP